jgi:hypothetical protein
LKEKTGSSVLQVFLELQSYGGVNAACEHEIRQGANSEATTLFEARIAGCAPRFYNTAASKTMDFLVRRGRSTIELRSDKEPMLDGSLAVNTPAK